MCDEHYHTTHPQHTPLWTILSHQLQENMEGTEMNSAY